MACRSPSIKKVADKTANAQQQIDKLEQMLQSRDQDFKKSFLGKIDERLAAAKVSDGREVGYNSAIKTEFTSEFSLDKIADVVKAGLKAAAAATDPKVPSPATSPAAMAAYADVVTTVAEAAKSSSTSASSLTFSMTRLCPGLFAFLFASSVSIKDKETFGTEAVTATVIYWRLMESIDDIRNETKWGAALIDAQSLLLMKHLQCGLADSIADGTLTIEEWDKKDSLFDKAIAKIQARLDQYGRPELKLYAVQRAAKKLPPKPSVPVLAPKTRRLASIAIAKLERTHPRLYRAAIERLQDRLETNYY